MFACQGPSWTSVGAGYARLGERSRSPRQMRVRNDRDVGQRPTSRRTCTCRPSSRASGPSCTSAVGPTLTLTSTSVLRDAVHIRGGDRIERGRKVTFKPSQPCITTFNKQPSHCSNFLYTCHLHNRLHFSAIYTHHEDKITCLISDSTTCPPKTALQMAQPISTPTQTTLNTPQHQHLLHETPSPKQQI